MASGSTRTAGSRRTGFAALAVVLAAFLSTAGCGSIPGFSGDGASPAGGSPGAAAVPQGMEALDERLRARIAEAPSAEVGLSVIDLERDTRLGINDRESMHAASTMKVPLLYELFRMADAGELDLDAGMEVRNQFTSIADGSTYSLDPEDDSEQELYEMIGETVPVRELARRMVVRSSNLATNILMERVTPDAIYATLAGMGAREMRVLRGVEDIPAYNRGMNNTTTAHAFARVLEAIGRCEGLSRASCAEVVRILGAQEFNDMIPAGLPGGVPVAHKTGWITEIHHDGGIVFPPDRRPYVLVVLTRGIAERDSSAALAADLSRIVWEEVVEGRTPAVAAGQGNRVAADAATAEDPSAGAEAGAGQDAARRATRERPAGGMLGDRPRSARTSLESMDVELGRLHDRHVMESIAQRRFTHSQLWSSLGPLADRAETIRRTEIGRSVEDRPIYSLRYGNGTTNVLLWSQMHGDESTATMALADVFNFLASEPDHTLSRLLAERLTIIAIPMLNPDGAERFQRRNAQGIDVNRDARMLSTPEGQALKAMQERYRPSFGFNLHDQNPRTRVGDTDWGTAIALLAPRPDASSEVNPTLLRAQQLAAMIQQRIHPMIPGRIARYDDTFNPRAFGDLMQSWGVSTVLIEAGGWEDDPEKQFLRKVNFVAILGALEGIATGEYQRTDVAWYRALPENGRSVDDLLIMGGTIVVPGSEPFAADLSVNYSDPLVAARGRISDIGDLREYSAADTLDVSGLFLHPRSDGAAEGLLGAEMSDDDTDLPSRGDPASFTVREGASAGSRAVWVIDEGVYRRVGR